MANDEQRYIRQQAAFPEMVRAETGVVELAGEASPRCSALLKAGAAAMGVPRIASDHHGELTNGRHWFSGDHETLVRTVNTDVGYGYVDPARPGSDLNDLLHGERRWAVVHLNAGRERCGEVLEQLAACPRMIVLLALAGPGGVVVRRYPDAATALQAVRAISGFGPVAQGPAELAMLAAGLCLNEIMLLRNDLDAPRLIGCYDLHRERRIDMPDDAPWEHVIADVSAAPGQQAAFSGRRVVQVGAGALGNWAALALALDGGLHLRIFDGDTVEASNLNRQVLLVRGLGRAKANVLTEELRELDFAGNYSPVARYVQTEEDIDPLDEESIVLALPDNDAARLLVSRAACRAGCLFAQGGTGAVAGQYSVHVPGRACLECVIGPGVESAGESCIAVAEDSVVASNAITAGLLVSEVRQALSGRRTRNLRFAGDGPAGSRLVRMVNGDGPCPHAAAGSGGRVSGVTA